MTTAWLALAVGNNRTHASNDGYDDDPLRHYSWDSTVPNHAAVSRGDVIALWDKKSLLGISVIEEIAVSEGEKNTYSCPLCGRASFKPRVRKLPRFLCWDCKGEFDVAVTHRKLVKTYRSRHESAWVSMPGLLTGSELRSLCDAPKSQQSLRPIRWERLRSAIQLADGPTSVTIAESTLRRMVNGHRHRTVRVRIGQGAFRKNLLSLYGSACAFTGPSPEATLEAAHLYSYAAVGEHHVHGGLLLRRDFHRLFDLGLVAVHPETLCLDISDQLFDFPTYAALHDQRIFASLSKGHIAWIENHWSIHRR